MRAPTSALFSVAASSLLLVAPLAGCGNTYETEDPSLVSGVDDHPPTYDAVDDSVDPVADAAPATDAARPDAGSVKDAGPAADAGGIAALWAVGTKLQTTANLNLRSAPDAVASNVLRVMPTGTVVVVVDGRPQNAFVKVDQAGLVGWASSKYLEAYTPAPTGTTNQLDYVARAKPAVGFGYWWGHGRWLTTGPTSANKGSCSGNCPSCTYSGSYGADCSGYVAKIWQVPASNTNVTVDSHPYSTDTFYNHQNKYAWRDVARDRAVVGDALVYRTSSAGHIFLVESGDPWGNMWVYEARGCSFGVMHDLRTAASAYKAIRMQ